MRQTEFKSLVSSAAIVLSISIMLLIHGDFPTKVGCADVGNKTDMLALLAFKNRITHDPLRVLNTWNQSLHFCRWKGVTCGRRHQRVIMLDLASQKLSGSMSPSIGNLSFLKIIHLSNNSFTGELPPETSRLFRLQHFVVVNNSFEGQIPVNLSSCSKLSVLNLHNNEFTGHVPSELGSLTKLVLLSAAKNYLTGSIPSSLGNLSALEGLYLYSNQLEGSIPDSLVDVKSLTVLSLGMNNLSGLVPHSVYNLSYLTLLYLGDNQFKGNLPRDLGRKNCLPYLERLSIWGNQFSGTLPTSLSNASNLQILELDDNRFVRGVPIDFGNMKKLYRISWASNNLGTGEVDDLSFITSLTNCSHLRILSISVNNFGGVLPNSLANISKTLFYLSIEVNQISGNIPQGIGNLVGLEAIGMHYNRLRGVIPETIGNLVKLQQAGFGKNNLSGRIPSSIGNLTILSWLYIEENSLEGSIPPSLGNCHSLQLLHLYGNELTGNIPREVIGLASLSISLNLSRNHLSGPIPLEVGSLKNLAELDVSHNKLSGEIPSSLGACTSLEGLYMNDNSLRGIIPNSLSSLRAIEELDLSLNNLTGELPKSLGTLSLLRKLNLSFNDFDGEVPLGGAFTNTSEVSLVGNKKLCGGIPDLGLPKCFANESRTKSMPLYLKVIISLVGGLLGLALVLSSLSIYWNKKPKCQPSSASLSVDPFMNLSYGDIFRATDGFSSLNLIGMGSFGSVYKGVIEPEGQVVAVKMLNLQNRGAARSFIAECEALRNIRHRNLVKVITACSSIDYQGNDFKALVYEFMPNGSLETWLHPLLRASNADHAEPRTLSLFQRVNILMDVAAALDYLHNHCEMPIIHRDLKPGNILLDNDMTAHVGDFGLAKITAQSHDELLQSQSSSSCIKGTIGYTPPEYGIGSAATTEGDVYSFGILVLEVFTGKRPSDHNMQVDGSNLQKMVTMALPEAVTEIIDHALVSEVEREGTIARKCLAAVFELGVACSVESPINRMDISDVANELSKIKDLLLKHGYQKNP